MFGDIIEYIVMIKLRWQSREGVVHLMVARRLQSTVEGQVTSGWETLCESDSWDERRPKLTRKLATCALCLGLEH